MTKRIVVLLALLVAFSNLMAQKTDETKKKERSDVNTKYNKFRFGGYGELLFQNMDFGPDRYNPPKGAVKDNRSFIDVPRFVLEFDYKFRSDIELVTEVEFEHGGTGSALELEFEEMGEYEMEMEKAGEVVLEQFYFKKSFSRAFNLKFGHMIVPIGLTNKSHAPTQFFTAVRPESENMIIPLTWHETGIAVTGKIRQWAYEFQVVNGLDANGFSSAHWVKGGKQGIFEQIKMTDPAFVLRIDNSSINNLRLGVASYYGNSAQNTAKPAKLEHVKGGVSISSFDFEYDNNRWISRGNFIYGHLFDSEEITNVNRVISKNIQYSRTPVAQNAMAYSLELGYNVFSHFKTTEKLIPFVRYEYYNSMEDVSGFMHKDKRYQREVLTFGVNYQVMKGLAFKADYSKRIISKGDYNTENTFSLALVFNTWFFNK